MTLGWLLVVGFIAIQLTMYALFRRWRTGVEISLQQSLNRLGDYSPSRNEVIATLRFSDDRKKIVWALIMVLLGIYACATVLVASGPPFTGDEAWIDFILLFFIVDIGSAVPWIGFVNPYGNIRVVTRDGLVRRSPWFLGTHFVRWRQIHWVKWIPLGNAFIVSTESGIFLVYSFLENIGVFANALMANLPEEKWAKARAMLTRALGGPFQTTL